MNKTDTPIKRALLSVSDKTSIEELARALHAQGVELLSTGGTARAIRSAGLPCKDASEITGFPEMMDGRVKTLHPLIHGGILGLRDQHQSDAQKNGIQWIDLVVCNLYPFESTVARESCSLDEALENIDIGGPSMIRSAAKNAGWTTVLTDPADYPLVIKELKEKQSISHATRLKLSARAFRHTARYDAYIQQYLTEDFLPEELALPAVKMQDMRYGENPHQRAAAYHIPGKAPRSILKAEILGGKALSYNNINDSDGALACLAEFSEPACVVVKHANPCGVATGSDISETTIRAFEADKLSAFGGIIAINRPCTPAIADYLAKIFFEIIIAPDYHSDALTRLQKKKNLRILRLPALAEPAATTPRREYRFVNGGLLIQDKDPQTLEAKQLEVVTKKQPSEENIQNMLFGWPVLKHVKSNGILLAKDNTTLSIGPGQVSRVDAVKIALRKGEGLTQGSVLCSDAFFPFRDNIDALKGSGIEAILQPGGSVRDQEVIDACNELGIAMAFTGKRCFKH